MYSGNFVFFQNMDHLPWSIFHQYVANITATNTSKF